MSTHEEITSSVNYEKGFNAGVKATEVKYKDIYDPNKRKSKG